MRILSISRYTDKLDTERLDNVDKTGPIGMILLIELASRLSISLFRVAMGMSVLMMDMGVSMDDAIGEPAPQSGCLTSFPIKYRNIHLTGVDRRPPYHDSGRYLPVGL